MRHEQRKVVWSYLQNLVFQYSPFSTFNFFIFKLSHKDEFLLVRNSSWAYLTRIVLIQTIKIVFVFCKFFLPVWGISLWNFWQIFTEMDFIWKEVEKWYFIAKNMHFFTYVLRRKKYFLETQTSNNICHNKMYKTFIRQKLDSVASREIVRPKNWFF